MKEASEGFLYISKRATTRPIISDLPSSHKHWKERYFFIGGKHWGYNPADQDDTLRIPTVWTTPENLREFSVHASRGQFFRGQVMFFDFVMVVLPSGIRPDLTHEDREVKWRLGKCRPQEYSDMIKSDLPGSSGVSPSSSPRSKSPPLLVMETSPRGPVVMKPTRGELRACVDLLAKKKRSVKHRAHNLPEGSLPTRGKVPKLGVSDPNLRAQAQVRGKSGPLWPRCPRWRAPSVSHPSL